MHNEINKESGLGNSKCIDCGACGHSGCCSPVDCKMLNNCIFCEKYLAELKATYLAYNKVYSLIYTHQEKYPDLFNVLEEIHEDLTD
jgi:predicted molibdopterin-dependent oxidoreductase YjgC